MTGYSVRGHMGFVPKDGENLTARLNVRFHEDTVEQMASLKRSGESLADFVRTAVREKIQRARGRR